MENNSNQTASAVKAKLIFKEGEYENKEKGYKVKRLISKFNGKIVYADPEKSTIKTGVSYDCDLRLSPRGKAYEVVSATKTQVITANLIFKKGNKVYNRTNDGYVENMVSTFNDEIVIAPETMKIQPYTEYQVGMVMSPNGRAYIVETAEPSKPAKANIVSDDAELSVDILVGGKKRKEFHFGVTEFDSERIEDGDCEYIIKKILQKIKSSNIKDREMIASNYEAICLDYVAKFKNELKNHY